MRIGIDLHGLGDLMQGSRTYIVNAAKALLALDAENEYFLYLPHPDAAEAREAFGAPNAVLRPIPPGRFARLVYPFARTLKKDGLDAVLFQYAAPIACPVPYVTAIHDIIHETNPEFFPGRLRRLMSLYYPASARGAAHVVTISDYSRRMIMERYRIPAERISYAHCGVSEEFAPPGEARDLSPILRKYGLSRPYVLFVGRIEPRKNLSGLIKAFERLVKEGGVPHKLAVAGMRDGLFSAHFSAMTAAARERVVFTGRVEQEDLPLVYAGADLLAYPSFAEGFGLPIIEAMACGTPVVCSDTSSMPEAGGEAALYADPADPAAIAAAMGRVLRDGNLARSMREKGLRHARAFRWEHTARMLSRTFREIAGR